MSTRRTRRTVLVVTGTRAEFGLLRPVMDAIKASKQLRLRVLATGTHLLPPARTIKEVESAYDGVIRAPMQCAGPSSRLNDAQALGRGIEGIARVIAREKPDWVVVLGDRIEALAGASAASVAGVATVHIHGGDRAEGIADEAMRHAITKLAHVHCAATEQSRERIIKLGERPEHVFNTGSPAIDALDKIKPMGDAEARKLGDPRTVMLLHPSGLTGHHRISVPGNLDVQVAALEMRERPVRAGKVKQTISDLGPEPEGSFAWFTLAAAMSQRDANCVLFMHPNHDPGREQILRTWQKQSSIWGWPIVPHLPRERFIALLKRLRIKGGLLVGNSSAGLIECAYLGVPALNVGPRQAGRERGPNVVDADPLDAVGVVKKVRKAEALVGKLKPSKLFGDGHAGMKIAALLAKLDPHEPALIRKRNTY